MAKDLVLADTSVLIDYFRKQRKEDTALIALVRSGKRFHISAITEFEIYSGVSDGQRPFWRSLLERIEVLPLGSAEAHRAVDIMARLKKARRQLSLPDVFIAATALCHGLPVATLNKRHFERVEGLKVI